MNITVYLGSNMGEDPIYREKVEELGHWIGAQGHGLIYGGSRVGLMGVLADAVLRAGGPVIGVEPDFFVRSALQHEGITQLIVTEDMAQRKAKMIELGDAFIAFPGGTGTLEEIAEIMSHNGIGLIDTPCILYNVNHFYDGLRTLLDRMTREGFVPVRSRSRIVFADSLRQIGEAIYAKG